MSVRLDSVERAIADFAAGRAVVVVDDEDRENEGDIVFAAAKATPELMAFTIRHSSGVICVPMPGAMLDRLEATFAAQRQLHDDVGHELRTPLTVMRGNLELLDPRGGPGGGALVSQVHDEARGVGQFGDYAVDLLLGGAADDDAPVVGELPGDLAPDAAGGSGDQDSAHTARIGGVP